MDRRYFLIKSLGLGGGLALYGKNTFSQLSFGTYQPAYKRSFDKGIHTKRIRELFNLYKSCCLCPRISDINRLKGETDICEAGPKVKISGAYPHFGEEKCLVGKSGSGTIFFSHCSLRCVFCINHEISWGGEGRIVSDHTLANIMLRLQNRGCKNINLVTPTHYLPNIVKAVFIAVRKGLSIPLVYNSSGYDRVKVLKLLDGIIDIYMPDLKFMDSNLSDLYCSGAKNYFENASLSILEMHRQVGNLITDERGNAVRGLIIRHLVMPNNQSNTDKIMQWIGANLPKSTYVNLMAQYRPEFKAREYPKISRSITRKEFAQAITWARNAGLTNLDQRSLRYY